MLAVRKAAGTAHTVSLFSSVLLFYCLPHPALYKSHPSGIARNLERDLESVKPGTFHTPQAPSCKIRVRCRENAQSFQNDKQKSPIVAEEASV